MLLCHRAHHVIALAALLAIACKDKPAETSAVDAAPAVDAATVSATDAAADAASASDAAADATAPARGEGDGDGRRGGGRGRPSAMLFQAAHGLDLKDEQKAKVEAAEKASHAGPDDASREAMKTASKELHTDLIAGIKAGKIDTAKLEPRYAAMEKVVAQGNAKEIDALTALHGALDATQRKAVTTAVRAKQAAREAKMAHRAGADGGAGDGGAALPHFPTKRALGRLTRGLELDAEQDKKVDAIVAKEDGKGRPDPAAEAKKSLEALLAAFEKDTFDAKKLDIFDAKKARGPMEQETKLVVQLLPILTPEQREKLAGKMEKGPSPHGRRGGFGNPPILEQQDDDD